MGRDFIVHIAIVASATTAGVDPLGKVSVDRSLPSAQCRCIYIDHRGMRRAGAEPTNAIGLKRIVYSYDWLMREMNTHRERDAQKIYSNGIVVRCDAVGRSTVGRSTVC